jgi:transposase
MYVAKIPNRGSKPAALLRESYREGGKVKNRTIANLSHLPPEKIDLLQRVLAGEKLVSASELVETTATLPSGHVRAVLGMMKKLGMADLVSSRPCRERSLVLGMIAERLLHPASKLGTLRLWGTSTLASELGVEDAKPEELYKALDWLLGRQNRIETKLAGRHLSEGGLALYDASNSLYEGSHCPLARLGHDKDGRRGAAVIAFGMMTDREGRPVALQVYPGNTGDPSTVVDQVLKLRTQFGLSEVVVVGDRGMVTRPNIEYLRRNPGLGWITALRTEAIRKLADGGSLQMSLFDERNLAEIESPDFPGERLVACFNPFLAEERRRNRESLLAATERLLTKVQDEVASRTAKPLTDGEIGKKVGRAVHRHKMAKHFEVDIAGGKLSWTRKDESIRREAELDGIYVIRTSEPVGRLAAEDAVRGYKLLAEVERAFRCLKGFDLRVRPVYLRDEDHVRAHFFLCMLAYYVEWHMRVALAPLLFEDPKVAQDRATRDPVARPEPSDSVKAKKKSKKTPEGLPVQSFSTLLAALSTQARVTYRVGAKDATFDQVTRPTPLQERAFDLLGV